MFRFVNNMKIENCRLTYVLILFAFAAIGLGSCKKENLNNQLGIPFVRVDEYIITSLPSNIPLNNVGGWIYYNGGSRGIVIYRRAFDEVVAFDRHCTWQSENACGTVSVDTTNNVILNCACCDSRFSLIDGGVLQGPSVFGLLPYRAAIIDFNTIRLFN